MRLSKIVVGQVGIAAVAAMVGGLALSGPAQAEKDVSFAQDVKPIIDEHCVACHIPPDGEGYKVSGLDLTSYAGVMKGTKYGQGKFPKEERNILRRWINQGAKDN